MENSVARVYLLDAPYHIDKLYDYYIPEELRGTLRIGGFVAVPFGGGNRKQLALVSGLFSASEYSRLKPVIAPVCGSIVLGDEMMGLCLYMKQRFLCTVGDAVKSIIPSSALTKLREIYLPASNPPKSPLPPKKEAILRFIEAKGRASEEQVSDFYGPSVTAALSAMVAEGYLERVSEFTDSRTPIIERAEISDEYSGFDGESLSSLVRGSKQKEALSALALYGEMELSELGERYGITKTVLKGLADKGLVKISSQSLFRDPYRNRSSDIREEIVLSSEQSEARDKICSLFDRPEGAGVLLHGVTGSGKTSVIKAVIDRVIQKGKSAIVLVPEIALTPQTVGFFRSFYGERAVVVHSGLSKGERYDAWRKIESGEADLCIGTRSAVFAPFKNLGLIVIDEEQESSYKSDMDPKYHARDIARYRCAKQGAVMLLSSATPSLDSYKKALEGKYTLIKLKNRYGSARLPETLITDLRADKDVFNSCPVGRELRERLEGVLERKEQAILFINQRGYNRFLSCPLCGHVLMCKNCSVSYTYHTVKNSDRGYLYCHYCGEKEPVPQKCPQCGNKVMRHVGYGTQMVEEELQRIFPQARTMRLDADTTSTKFSYDDLLGKFREGEADILIGTQMVTKGHDFPNVTLVGVINADTSLYLNDYKANERTFALLTQVIGRAGRGDKSGCALIQTYNPAHPTLAVSSEQNYEKMYQSEIALRHSLVFPPYCDMVCFTLSSVDERELMSASVKLHSIIEQIKEEKYSSIPIVIFGPMEAPLYKIGGVYRMRIIIKCRFNKECSQMMSEVLSTVLKEIGGKIGISADVNPSNL